MVGGFVAGDGARGGGYGYMKNDSTESKECYTWPRGRYGKGPWCNPTDQEKEMIINLVGEKHLKSVMRFADHYLMNLRYYEKISINELNKKLFAAGEHAAALDELLEDDIFLAFLQNKFEQFLSRKHAEKLVTNPNSTLTSSAMHHDLFWISFVSSLVKNQQSGRGRPPGAKKIAERQFIEQMYLFCTSVLDQRPTNNPKGTLQQLIKILNRPLELGGNLPGLVRQVIDDKTAEEKRWRDSTLK